MILCGIHSRAGDWSWAKYLVSEHHDDKVVRTFLGTWDECQEVFNEWTEEEHLNKVSSQSV